MMESRREKGGRTGPIKARTAQAREKKGDKDTGEREDERKGRYRTEAC